MELFNYIFFFYCGNNPNNGYSTDKKIKKQTEINLKMNSTVKINFKLKHFQHKTEPSAEVWSSER